MKSQTNSTATPSNSTERAKNAEKQRKYRAKNADANKQYMREYRAKNRDRIRTLDRERYAKNPRKRRSTNTKALYGITLDDRDALLAQQGGVCAICGADNPQRKNAGWHIDHCHSTGIVRGILCHPCNVMLGHARDNSHTLAQAIHYLEKHNG